MNDRFKFRAYNKELRKMYEVNTICPYEDNHTKGGEVFLNGIQYNSFYFPEEVEVMQCTGLKDKNGKLIYEGDIVEVKYIGGQIPLFKNEYVNEPESERFQIYWNENWCSWSGKNDNYRGLCEIHSLDISKFLINTDNKLYEVIGNIYENEELLEDAECRK